MVTPIELAILVLVVAFFVGARRVVDTVKPFIVNTIVGLIVLVLAGWLGVGIVVTPLVLLVVAIGGAPGAVLVILLHLLDIAFVGLPLV
ncbi:hypothetical protein [Haloarchaeobius amylolyticus]|uniref:hypothetical protein n=1 Tax=Haloarchaeobius amylolyticus TaxID=1198296 RepID=UPI0022720E80|nr:hypothetical protein [Haloarchaeobius amylolyticus]